MRGPKTEMILQKPTETSSGGTWSTTWSDVETIRKAVLRPFSAEEKMLYGQDSVITMKKVLIGYKDITEANRQYLTAEGKILIDSVEHDIESVEPATGRGSYYKVILRKVQ